MKDEINMQNQSGGEVVLIVLIHILQELATLYFKSPYLVITSSI